MSRREDFYVILRRISREYKKKLESLEILKKNILGKEEKEDGGL